MLFSKKRFKPSKEKIRLKASEVLPIIVTWLILILLLKKNKGNKVKFMNHLISTIQT